MRKAILVIVLFSLVVLEGVALELLPENLINLSVMIVPHWILVFLIILSFFYDIKEPEIFVVYVVIFGLLIDIVYTNTLGVYMFAYGIALYTAILFKRFLQENLVMTIFTTIISILIAEGVIGGIYTLLGITNVYWLDNLTERLIPTLLANIVFLLILYPIVKSVLNRLKNRSLS